MNIQNLTAHRTSLANVKQAFYYDLFNDDIWGDNGTDIATICIISNGVTWKLQYLRIQSGIPYPFAQAVSNIIDEYEKELTDEALYDYLLLHNILHEFQTYIEHVTNHQ